MPGHDLTDLDPLRLIFYGRKSDEDDGISVAQQERWAEEVVPGLTYQGRRVVLCKPPGRQGPGFSETGIAGWKISKRGAFLAALAYCEAEAARGVPIDGIATFHGNRLSRSDSFNTFEYLKKFRAVGTHLIFTASDTPRDLWNSNDRMVLGIMQEAVNFGGMKSMAAACLRGRADVARLGQHAGGRVLYGYKMERKVVIKKGQHKLQPQRYEIDEPRAAVVLRAFTLFADTDTSERAIARLFNREGVKGPPSKKYPEGGKWTAQAVGRMLRNEKYTGDMPYGKNRWGQFVCLGVGLEVVERDPRDTPAPKAGSDEERAAPVVKKARDQVFSGARATHDAIIDRPLWDRVQVKIAARANTTTTRAGDRPFLLSGIFFCGMCGRPMQGRRLKGKSKKSGGVYQTFYVCTGYHNDGRDACTHNQTEEGPLVAAIVKKLRAALTDPARLAALRGMVRGQEESEPAGADPVAEVEGLRKQAGEMDAKIRYASRQMLDPANEPHLTSLREALLELQQERAALAARIDAAAKQTPKAVASLDDRVARAVALLDCLEEALVLADPAVSRELLGQLLERLEGYYDRRETAKRTYSPFSRALVFPRADLVLGTWATPETISSLDSCQQWQESKLDIAPASPRPGSGEFLVITAADLAAAA